MSLGAPLRLIEEFERLDGTDSAFPYELLYEMRVGKLMKFLNNYNDSNVDMSTSRVYGYFRVYLGRLSAVAMEYDTDLLTDPVNYLAIQTILCRVVLPRSGAVGFRTQVAQRKVACVLKNKMRGYFRLAGANDENITFHVLFQRRKNYKNVQGNAMKDAEFIIEQVESRNGEVSIHRVKQGRIFKDFHFLIPKSISNSKEIQSIFGNDFDLDPRLGDDVLEFKDVGHVGLDSHASLGSSITEIGGQAMEAMDKFKFGGYFNIKFSRFIFEEILEDLYRVTHEEARIKAQADNKAMYFRNYTKQLVNDNKQGADVNVKSLDSNDKEDETKDNSDNGGQKVIFMDESGKSQSKEISLVKLLHCKYFNENKQVGQANEVWKVKLPVDGKVDEWIKFLRSDGKTKVQLCDFEKIYFIGSYLDSLKWRRLVAREIGKYIYKASAEKLDEFFPYEKEHQAQEVEQKDDK